MAITKTSAKSESWTLRVPKDLAIAVRDKFPAEAGVTEIVLQSLKAFLGKDNSDLGHESNIVLQNDLQEIRLRLDTLEEELSDMKSSAVAAPITKTRALPAADKGNDSEWTNTEVIASRLEVLGITVKPKSISGAFSKRGEDKGNGIVEITMEDQTIQRQVSGKETKYRIIVTQ